MKTISTLFLILITSFYIQAQDSTPLSETAFEKLRKEIADQSYDSKRLLKAKELSDAHYLYVNQIKAIMEGMSLEGNRLEYAKYAYGTTLDAEKYSTLDAIFRMEDSKKDLKDYISKRKPPVVPQKEEPVKIVETPVVNTTKESSTTTTTASSTTTVKTTGPTPMNDQDFATAKRQVAEESFESNKLRRAKQISDANYMLCSQIKEIVEVLGFESSKLEYAQYAHAKTYDPSNYDIVKSGLVHSKSREDLTAFVKKQKVVDYSLKAQEEAVVVNNVVAVENTNNTSAVISNEDYAAAKSQISAQSSDTKKLEYAKKITDRTTLTTAQVKGILELFLFEPNRLDYAKHAYPKTVDKENFASVKDLIEKEDHKTLDDFIKTAGTSSTTKATVTTGPSELSAEDFEALVKSIKGSALESHKLEKAKTMVDRAHLNSNQIKQVNELFSLEEDRLEFAKYAYPKALDKDKYSIVRETMSKSTSKYSLDKFIKEYK